MAIRSLTNHASIKMNISVTVMKAPITAAMLQIIIGLSEQQERMSAKYKQRKMSENSIAPQQAQSVVSQKQVLIYTVAKRNRGYKIANTQPKRTGDILLYLILLHRMMKQMKAKHWVMITASKGRQIPQSCYFCQSLFTKYTILDSPESLEWQSTFSLIKLTYIFQVTSAESFSKVTLSTGKVTDLLDKRGIFSQIP